jgi:hypothetical protein
MAPMSFNLHENHLPFSGNIRHNIQLTPSILLAWAYISADYPPSYTLQMRRRDILTPASSLNAAIQACGHYRQSGTR